MSRFIDAYLCTVGGNIPNGVRGRMSPISFKIVLSIEQDRNKKGGMGGVGCFGSGKMG